MITKGKKPKFLKDLPSKLSNIESTFLLCFAVLGIKRRALSMLGKYSTTDTYPQPQKAPYVGEFVILPSFCSK